MTNDKSNKELDKSTLRIPTFNMILRQILVVNAYGDKSLSDEILLQDELFYNTVSQLNFQGFKRSETAVVLSSRIDRRA